jgi:hypothetical protein
MKISATVSMCKNVSAASAAATTASTIWQACSTRLRSYRSAAWPAAKVNAASGTNCASPTSPRSYALCVSA